MSDIDALELCQWKDVFAALWQKNFRRRLKPLEPPVHVTSYDTIAKWLFQEPVRLFNYGVSSHLETKAAHHNDGHQRAELSTGAKHLRAAAIQRTVQTPIK